MTKFYWLNFPFIRYVLFLILGILIEDFLGLEIGRTIFIIILLCIISLHFFASKFKALSIISPFYLLIVMFTGMFFHAENTKKSNLSPLTITAFSGIIISEVKRDLKFYKFQLNLNKVYKDNVWEDFDGKVNVYLRTNY